MIFLLHWLARRQRIAIEQIKEAPYEPRLQLAVLPAFRVGSPGSV